MGENRKDYVFTSSAPGRVKLKFRSWNVVVGRFVQDKAVQRGEQAQSTVQGVVNRKNMVYFPRMPKERTRCT